MSEKITFKQLVELIAKQAEQSESSANSFIHELVQIIEGGLKQSGSVSISGFGKFELRWMKERPGVNPQTGDEITIPGQNKVVFKPYKALRETVNKPFAGLEPEILSETSDSDEETEKTEDKDDINNGDPFGLEGVFGSEDPFKEEEDPFDDDDSFDSDDPLFEEDDPFRDRDEENAPFELDDDLFDEEQDDPFEFGDTDEPHPYEAEKGKGVDDLIFEHENPHFGQRESQEAIDVAEEVAVAKEETAVVEIEKEEEKPVPQEEQPKVTPLLKDESKMAEEVQKSGSFKWSYAAAVIIVIIALIILFLMMQRSSESSEETAPADTQTEQMIEPSTSDEATSGESAEEPQQTVDEESPPQTSGPPPGQLETESYTVESGQSLWDIAESQLGNPYLWPVIYHLNQDLLGNPNQLAANANIEIPAFSNPDNLSEFEREQVALGYFSLYQWNRDNNPDEARYFLWAVGVFSQDLLDQPPSEVDQQDLAFARNR